MELVRNEISGERYQAGLDTTSVIMFMTTLCNSIRAGKGRVCVPIPVGNIEKPQFVNYEPRPASRASGASVLTEHKPMFVSSKTRRVTDIVYPTKPMTASEVRKERERERRRHRERSDDGEQGRDTGRRRRSVGGSNQSSRIPSEFREPDPPLSVDGTYEIDRSDVDEELPESPKHTRTHSTRHPPNSSRSYNTGYAGHYGKARHSNDQYDRDEIFAKIGALERIINDMRADSDHNPVPDPLRATPYSQADNTDTNVGATIIGNPASRVRDSRAIFESMK